MPKLLTDEQIGQLLVEKKTLPDNWASRLRLREKSDVRFRQRDLDVQGEHGNRFRIILRQSTSNPLDFSIVLVFVDSDGSSYRLTRYNGRHSSQHTNQWEKRRGLEGATFRNRFHIHRATERYQAEELEIDGFAEPTDKYSSFQSALQYFLSVNGFSVSDQADNAPLFSEKGDDNDND